MKLFPPTLCTHQRDAFAINEPNIFMTSPSRWRFTTHLASLTLTANMGLIAKIIKPRKKGRGKFTSWWCHRMNRGDEERENIEIITEKKFHLVLMRSHGRKMDSFLCFSFILPRSPTTIRRRDRKKETIKKVIISLLEIFFYRRRRRLSSFCSMRNSRRRDPWIMISSF